MYEMIRKACLAALFCQIRWNSGICEVLRRNTLKPFNAKNNCTWSTRHFQPCLVSFSHKYLTKCRKHHYFQESLQWGLSWKMLSYKISVAIKLPGFWDKTAQLEKKIKGFFLVSTYLLFYMWKANRKDPFSQLNSHVMTFTLTFLNYINPYPSLGLFFFYYSTTAQRSIPNKLSEVTQGKGGNDLNEVEVQMLIESINDSTWASPSLCL